ncbi:MAG: alpha/beta hydrolase-fold protein, partial [Rhodothermales bacterium]|nr:alpha/beta hydrolase-fold protein [Rhodothermales bacterium]
MTSIAARVFTATIAVLSLHLYSCSHQEPRLSITVFTSTPVAAAETVFVAGNLEQLGNWQPRVFALTRDDSSTWSGAVSVPKDSSVEFKITRGSWAAEALAADGSIPTNHSLVARSDSAIRIVVTQWKDQSDARTTGITGTVEYIRQMSGDGIPPRDIVVWLPPGYEHDTTKRYPVLYGHDGQNLFNPMTSYTGIDWQLDEHVDSLSAAGRMAEIIMVGIYNTPERSEEYDVSDAGLAYLDFIVNRLKPHIDTKYRTLPDREHTAVMGASMGGTISFLALWKYPHVFSKAACVSPYFPPSLPHRVGREDWDISGLRLY